MASSSSSSSQQPHEEPTYESSRMKVTILASEWGSSKGGLSTINRELAIQLAKFPEAEITFFLPQCSEEDKNIALSHNIKIEEATRRPGYEELDWLSFLPKHLRVDVIVGHGVKLGHQAQIIRDSHKCRWVQVVHTDPEELGMFKLHSNPISKGEEKHNVEVELCQMADFVVGIGPKLTEAFRAYLRWCGKDQSIHDLTPGIFDEFQRVQQVWNGGGNCGILVFGRGDPEDFALKGFDIAGRAVASLPYAHLVFVGAPNGKHEEIAARLLECGIPRNRLKVRGYVNNRENLKRLFCEVDLVLMPSRTEGFGLAGLEALSAGLPVLVSGNSGFGQALSKVPFGSSFVINSEEPQVWAAAIKEIWDKDRKVRLKEAEALRTSYGKEYSWTKQSKDLLQKMIDLTHDLSASCHSSVQSKGRMFPCATQASQRTGDLSVGHPAFPSSSSLGSSYDKLATIGSLKGEALILKSKGDTVTLNWKQGSFFGIGGDKSQNYILCDYTTSRGNCVPVYIQAGWDIPQNLKIDSKLQYGTQDVLFFVYHDKSQTPYQEGFRCSELQKTVYEANPLMSWTIGHYLVNV